MKKTEDLFNHLSAQKRITVKVRVNAPETKITGYEDNLLKMDIAAQPENNKANIELIKFLSKRLKKPIRIISGFRDRKKVVEVIG